MNYEKIPTEDLLDDDLDGLEYATNQRPLSDILHYPICYAVVSCICNNISETPSLLRGNGPNMSHVI